jgi:hypothetical protein
MTEQVAEATPRQEQEPATPAATDGKDWQAEAEKWKSLSRKNEEAAKANSAAAKRLEELEAASKSDLERAVDAARKEGAQAATQTANARLVKAEARALAASAKFRDPSDAVAFLGDLSSVKVDSEGSVDTTALERALADLAKAKPYLLAEEPPTRPTGNPGQGPRDNGPAGHGALMNDLIRATRG